MRSSVTWGVLIVVGLTASISNAADDAPKSRNYKFTYAATITELPPAKTVRIWIPVPPTTSEQEVKLLSKKFAVEPTIGTDPVYGNKIMYLEVPAGTDGTINLEAVYEVKRKEVKGPLNDRDSSADRIKRYLAPDVKVPIDGKPLTLIKDKKLPDDATQKAKVFYEIVNAHMKYDKSKPGWGEGDSAWACDSKFGNCTDFHSLFISLARSEKMPARFEIGFSIPTQRGAGDVTGYHCWAFFRPSDKGWVPVDISEANKDPKLAEYYFGNLTEDRIAMTSGRDITLVPAQKGSPLNFFVFPYVEMDDKPLDKTKVKMRCKYEDAK